MGKPSDKPIARMRPANITVPEAISLSELTLSLLKVVGTVGPIVLAVFGVASSGLDAGFGFDFAGAHLPIRLGLFVMISTALGWSLGALLLRLIAARRDAAAMAAHLIAIIWGMLLVGSALWLAGEPANLPLPELFVVVGLSVAFVLLRFRFRAGAAYAGPRQLRVRSEVILSFAAAAFLVLLASLSVGHVQ